MKFTIFGGRGFIGSAIARHLQERGYEVSLPSRSRSFDTVESNLGHVIYCIGLTGDFRVRPFDTIDAHVCELAKLMSSFDFDSWLYLSSTRVYSANNVIAKESERLSVFPDSDGIYDISKLLGESLCLSLDNEKVRVARLSNVYGEGQSTNTFLGAILDEMKKAGRITISETADSAKDYISVVDAVDILIKIAVSGEERLYNVASGFATSHFDIAKVIEDVSRVPVFFTRDAKQRVFPDIDISKIKQEFNFIPRPFLAELPILIEKLSWSA